MDTDLRNAPVQASTLKGSTTTTMVSGFFHWLMERLSRDYFVAWHGRLHFVRHPLTVLTTVGVASAIVAVCLDERAWPPAVVSAAAIVLGLAWPRIGLLPMSGELSFAARRAVEGEPTIARLRLANRAPWRAWGLCLEAEGRSESDLTALAPLGGFSDETFAWELTPVRRGLFPRRLPCLSTGFPFGLERRRKTIDAPEPLLVLPRTWPIVGLPSPRRLPSFDGTAESNRTGATGTTLGVRPYRRGDGRRDVHWRQTARHGELIVRERETHETARVRLVVDNSRTACGFDDPEAVLDWLARFTASIAEQTEYQKSPAIVELARSAAHGGFVKRGTALSDVLGRLEFSESSSSQTFRTAAQGVARGIEPWFITTAAGYARLSAEERTAAGWTFFVMEAAEELSPAKYTLDSATGRQVFAVSLPLGSTREQYTEEGAFHVRTPS